MQPGGRQLERDLNIWWCQTSSATSLQLDSVLELEFETHYKRFLMPTVRGSDKGSKKRYAGVVAGKDGDQLVFKGLENVRTDWTRLARSFQEELYRRIFFQEPYEGLCKSCDRTRSGGRGGSPVSLSQTLAAQAQGLPTQCASSCAGGSLVRRARPARSRPGDWVEYVITASGPEPAAQPLATLDYQHYVDRQLAPVADGILIFVGNSFRTLTDKQIGLF